MRKRAAHKDYLVCRVDSGLPCNCGADEVNHYIERLEAVKEVAELIQESCDHAYRDELGETLAALDDRDE